MTIMKPRAQRRAVLIAAGSLGAVVVLGAGIFIGKLQPMSSQTASAAATTVPAAPLPKPVDAPLERTQPSVSLRPATPAPTVEARKSTPATPAALPPAVRGPEPQPSVSPYNPPPMTYPTTPPCPKDGGVTVVITDVRPTRTYGVFDFYQATITVDNTTGMPITSSYGSSVAITFRYGADKTDQDGGWSVSLPPELPPGPTVLRSSDDDHGISAYYEMDVPITSFRIRGPVDFINTSTDRASKSRYCSWSASLGKPLVGSWGP